MEISVRKKIVIANWKMNLTVAQGVLLAKELLQATLHTSTEIVIAPTFLHISELQNVLRETKIEVAAQNCCDKENGAFTGEVSAGMLSSIGVKKVLIGHSERRIFYHETNDVVKQKINIALANGLTPVFCCGEAKEIRERDEQNSFVLSQLKESLFHLSETDFQKIIIAYEPIWAIGTGCTAKPEQAQEMHHFIRQSIAKNYSEKIANAASILYGGSVNASNAAELFALSDVDGGLVGSASLKVEEFIQIIHN